MYFLSRSTPRSTKPWLGGNKFKTQAISNTSLESVFHSGTKCGGSSTSKLAQARLLHQSVCEVLLEAHHNLQNTFKEFLMLLPQWQQLQQSQGKSAKSVTHRLKKLCDQTKVRNKSIFHIFKFNVDLLAVNGSRRGFYR